MFKSKVKNAQEAHEAIRPTDFSLSPEKVKSKLEKDFYNLYDLIWKRTIASQMENVIMDLVVAHLDSKDGAFGARATGSTIAFDGFYRIYREGIDDEKEEENKILPVLKEGEQVKTEDIIQAQHFTEAPPRYSEASLVKKLEELGIGRPSTVMRCVSGSALLPSSITVCPSTAIRPSRIHCSDVLRDAIPAAARIFCSLSGMYH